MRCVRRQPHHEDARQLPALAPHALLAVALFNGVLASACQANINIEFRTVLPSYVVGNTVGVGVFVRSDSGSNQLMSAAQIIIGWDTTFLRLLGNSNAGAVPLLSSGFPMPDPYGLNEASPPQDGNGLYVAFANFGMPVAATPAGTLLTTLQFQALAETLATPVSIIRSGGNPVGNTTVFDGTIPNFDVTGTLTGSTVTIVPAPTAGLVVLFGSIPGVYRRRRR